MTEMNHYLEQERKIAELQKRVTSLESLCFQSKPVLNLEEASIYLGISRSMLYKMTHAGKIDFYKPEGKLIFFEKESLLNWALIANVEAANTKSNSNFLKLISTNKF